MPGWEGSRRRQQLPKDWDKVRRRVLIRDQRSCRWIREDTGRRCGEHATEVDHIKAGGSDEEWNLQALCEYHHQRKSSSEGGAARAAARRRNAGRLRRTEIHPALAAGTDRGRQ